MKKRHRHVDPRKARLATCGGLFDEIIPEKRCGTCGELRRSVDESGACGYCRAVAVVRRPVEAAKAEAHPVEVDAGDPF